MAKALIISFILLFGIMVLSGCNGDEDDYKSDTDKGFEESDNESNHTDESFKACGKAVNSIYRDYGYIARTRGMEDLIKDDSLECFGEILLMDSCVEASIEISHYSQSQGGSDIITDYEYITFTNDGKCYIKGIYLDSTNPSAVYQREKTIACEKDLTDILEEYETFDISPEEVINTFTEDYLNKLHMQMQGFKFSVSEEEASCFVVE